MMLLALPIWRDRISPVLDTATKLMLVRWESGQASEHQELPLIGESLQQRVAQLAGQDIDLLLCGAVSGPLHNMLLAAGINVVPFLSGDVQAVLAAYRDGRLSDPQLAMPGCCRRGQQCGPGHGQGHGHGRRCGKSEERDREKGRATRGKEDS